MSTNPITITQHGRFLNILWMGAINDEFLLTLRAKLVPGTKDLERLQLEISEPTTGGLTLKQELDFYGQGAAEKYLENLVNDILEGIVPTEISSLYSAFQSVPQH